MTLTTAATFPLFTSEDLEGQLEALTPDNPAYGFFIGHHMGGWQLFGPKVTPFGRERIGEFTWQGLVDYLNAIVSK